MFFFLPPIGHSPPFHPSLTFPPSLPLSLRPSLPLPPPSLPPPSTCRRVGRPPWKTRRWRRHHPKPEARDRRRSKSWSASSTATCWSTRCRGCWETRRTASWSWTTVAKCRRSELQRLKRPPPRFQQAKGRGRWCKRRNTPVSAHSGAETGTCTSRTNTF